MTDPGLSALPLLALEGPLPTAAFLAGKLEVEARYDPTVRRVMQDIEYAVALHDIAGLRIVLHDALLYRIGTETWQGWCEDVLAWTAEPEAVDA